MVGLNGVDNHWDDAHDTFEQDINGVERQGRQAVASLSIANDADKTGATTVHGSSGRTSPISLEHASEAASVRSMPVIDVPESPYAWRPSGDSNEIATPPTSRRPVWAAESHMEASDGRIRRSAIEVRSSDSPNRLSGFFTNFMNRRDGGLNTPSRNTFREETIPHSPNPGSLSPAPPRPSSPVARATTPPPELPPPTLQELGLSFSVLTSHLSPSHFSTPPWGGTVLRPHYLLLCHSQGLDVLSLASHPVPEPYALVRRVCFKSVVVMEQRGVLVAIAGRRDGVRVYALEEVKKAIEWRIHFEGQRKRERIQKEAALQAISATQGSGRDSSIEKIKLRVPSTKVLGRRSAATTPKIRSQPSSVLFSCPPPYISPTDAPSRLSPTYTRNSRLQHPSVGNFLLGTRHHLETDYIGQDAKAEWEQGSSDDEAINVVAAGASGSQALDERTSVIHPSTQSNCPLTLSESRLSASHSQTASPHGYYPENPETSMPVDNETQSPTPALLTLRRSLSRSPGNIAGEGHESIIPTGGGAEDDAGLTLAQVLLESRLPHLPPVGTRRPQQPILIVSSATTDAVTQSTPRTSDEEDDREEGRISLAQALLESRLPHLPPVGTRRPQQPIFITSATSTLTSSTRRVSEISSRSGHSEAEPPERRRHRWSVLDDMLSHSVSIRQSFDTTRSPERLGVAFDEPNDTTSGAGPESCNTHSQSNFSRGLFASSASVRTLLAGENHRTPATVPHIIPDLIFPSSRPGIIPRLISRALRPRRSEEPFESLVLKLSDEDGARSSTVATNTTPPKLEYVKLPGTKGALLVKAVETPKKSFLAILCGENGEKVELFAGTYRTALGLSRTFILPDSPRSLELQLQGDDLVEVFLVFSQNVFGLEPATVRVREVRIGRAERRAARRRARVVRTGGPLNEGEESQMGDEDNNVNDDFGVTISVVSNTASTRNGDQSSPILPPETEDPTPFSSETSNAEELTAISATQMGPYTTFQQLSFAPSFPLASIADSYIIPPTYPEFLQYHTKHELETPINMTECQIQGSPQKLPMLPSMWLYRDPKGVVHGPWKASLMQAWYKEGLLPPDLPVKIEGEDDFILLKNLRLQCADPRHPFRSPSASFSSEIFNIIQNTAKPLLPPISLLSQPKHFGPPALFFSSRGGHSTAIVDARGRSVLKGRFMWSSEHDGAKPPVRRMGDVKHLEAFDVKDRAVLVAMRQGGLEAVDFGDALLKPADKSRTELPHFGPPHSNINRRRPFVWKIGTPVRSSSLQPAMLSSKSKGNSLFPNRKSTIGASRPIGKMEFSLDDDNHDEVLFLGRKDDEIYICERHSGSFRILRLCPL